MVTWLRIGSLIPIGVMCIWSSNSHKSFRGFHMMNELKIDLGIVQKQDTNLFRCLWISRIYVLIVIIRHYDLWLHTSECWCHPKFISCGLTSLLWISDFNSFILFLIERFLFIQFRGVCVFLFNCLWRVCTSFTRKPLTKTWVIL